QKNNGGWAYHCQVLTQDLENRLMDELKSQRFMPGNFFVPGQLPGRDDNSIGQFVTLALWAARRHNVPVNASLRQVDQRYRSRQSPDGSWQYSDFNMFLKDTSTCAGLIGLAVAHGVENEGGLGGKGGKGPVKDIARDPLVERGLKYLGR